MLARLRAAASAPDGKLVRAGEAAGRKRRRFRGKVGLRMRRIPRAWADSMRVGRFRM